MEVVNRKFYHFHRKDVHPEIWNIGNEIIVDNNYKSRIGDKFGEMYTKAVDLYLKHLANSSKNNISLIEFNKLVGIGNSKFSNMFQREVLMEVSRRLTDLSLPSRSNSIYLCDEDSVKHWKNTLDENLNLGLKRMGFQSFDFNFSLFDLYIVSATGEVFKSSDDFIPDCTLEYEEILEKSKVYWNPDFKEEYQNRQAEYLFQGKIKVLDIIDR